MASLTFAQLMTRIRYYVNDTGAGVDGKNGITWNDIEIMMAINDAIRDGWNSFWFETWDETSFIGTNAIAANTNEIEIPGAYALDSFYGQPITNLGEIFSIWTRTYYGTSATPYPYPWTQVRNGVKVDNPQAAVTSNTPKIRFIPPYNYSFEMRLYGCRPIPPQPAWNFTSAAADSFITATDTGLFAGLNIPNGSTVIFYGNTSLGMSPINIYYVRDYTVGLSGIKFKVSDTNGGAAKVLTSDGAGNFFITSHPVPGSDYNGFINYLLHKTAEYLHRTRINSANRENHLAEAQLEQQLAEDERKRHKMLPQFKTEFNFRRY